MGRWSHRVGGSNYKRVGTQMVVGLRREGRGPLLPHVPLWIGDGQSPFHHPCPWQTKSSRFERRKVLRISQACLPSSHPQLIVVQVVLKPLC